MTQTFTPGPWTCLEAVSVENGGSNWSQVLDPDGHTIGAAYMRSADQNTVNARLFAAAREMLHALKLHKAWADSERKGPDYHGMTRDTHPDGEFIWKAWWNYNLDLCERANNATDDAIAKAEGR